MIHILTCAVIMLLSLGSPSMALEHNQWDVLLQKHVHSIQGGQATQVDYSGFGKDRKLLTGYLDSLSAVSKETFDSWPFTAQLAFLINAYNAWTVELILTKYPNITTIKELGSLFQSPWKKRFIPLLGAKRTLDDIEHQLIRGSGRYNEPRIHFAVNCASVGCPALKPEAYNEKKLEQQLEEATRLFLQDRTRNRIEESTLKVSSIFKWYKDDFDKAWRGTDSLRGFLALYYRDLGLTSSQKELLINKKISIKFLDYDWTLNDKK